MRSGWHTCTHVRVKSELADKQFRAHACAHGSRIAFACEMWFSSWRRDATWCSTAMSEHLCTANHGRNFDAREALRPRAAYQWLMGCFKVLKNTNSNRQISVFENQVLLFFPVPSKIKPIFWKIKWWKVEKWAEFNVTQISQLQYYSVFLWLVSESWQLLQRNRLQFPT